MVSAEDQVDLYEIRLALGAAIACADVDVQVSSSLVRMTYVASDVEKPFELSLPHEVQSEDAVVKWHRRSHELWLSLPWLNQEDEDHNIDGMEQSEMMQVPGIAQAEEIFCEGMSDARLPGGMTTEDLWRLSGALESVSWYKMCPVPQVPVLATGDESQESSNGGFFAKLRNSFLDICTDSSPKRHRRSHSESSRHKHEGDLSFPQYVHTFHFRRTEKDRPASKASPPSVVVSAKAALHNTSNSNKSATGWLDMTAKTKMRAQAQPFTPAVPSPVCMGPRSTPTQPVVAACVPTSMCIPWSASCPKLAAARASGPAPPPAPPPALPPLFAPALAPPAPSFVPEIVPEAVAQKPVPWGNVPYQLPLDKLIPEISSNCDSPTTEGSTSPSSSHSVATSSTPENRSPGVEQGAVSPAATTNNSPEGWRPSLRLVPQDEDCKNSDDLDDGIECEESRIEEDSCANKSACNPQKGASWKPTLRMREEAAGLQKQEIDKFEQALLDRPRYW